MLTTAQKSAIENTSSMFQFFQKTGLEDNSLNRSAYRIARAELYESAGGKRRVA